MPLVSIVCITYNHEAFIKDALDGFVMQKTDFPFEIIVHDDASTDGTANIIREYEAKYPELFVPIYQSENQFSKVGVSIWEDITFPKARGKYVALCEGDDYWTDPLKLQKQFDFLEANPEYTFSMGRVDILIEKSGKIIRMKEPINPLKKETYTLKDYLKSKFSQTSSFIFRNTKEPLPEWFRRVHAQDQSLVIIMTGNGKIKYHRDLFSIYRMHDNSITYTAPYNVYEKFLLTLKYWQIYLNFDYNLIFKIRSYSTRQKVKLNKCKCLINKVICHFKIECSTLILKFL